MMDGEREGKRGREIGDQQRDKEIEVASFAIITISIITSMMATAAIV